MLGFSGSFSETLENSLTDLIFPCKAWEVRSINKGLRMYVIQNRTNLKYLSLENGVEWISSKYQAAKFKLPETARSVRRSFFNPGNGYVERREIRENRMLVVVSLTNE